MRPNRAQRGSVMGRLLKWIAFAILAWVGITSVAVLLLRWLNPPTSAFMLRARVQAAIDHDASYHTDYRWVSLERISPHVALAVIASEDQLFPFHNGFDLKSIREAVRASERGKRLRGASTISQQVAKNLFLWSGHSFFRKGLEAWFTVLIEHLWGKRRIMEVYLNVAETGIHTYGANAGAQRYFHHDASRLSPMEAARIAAVLPLPSEREAIDPHGRVLRYGNRILARVGIVQRGGYDRCVR